MKVKICGMKHPENIQEVAQLSPDFMGFIYYPPSPRNINVEDISDVIKTIDEKINKVLVFVNEPLSEIERIASELGVNHIQLHGEESASDCLYLKSLGLKCIKVFHVNDDFSWDSVMPYEGCVDYYLFDTKSTKYGGSGVKFNWNVLENYRMKTPFFLSGGISAQDIDDIKNLKIKLLEGIDANSKLEIKPALKDILKCQELIQKTSLS